MHTQSKTVIVRFEDNGQDFLRWTIRDGMVVDSDMQSWIWEGTKILSEPKIGECLSIEHLKVPGRRKLNYKVTAIIRESKSQLSMEVSP